MARRIASDGAYYNKSRRFGDNVPSYTTQLALSIVLENEMITWLWRLEVVLASRIDYQGRREDWT